MNRARRHLPSDSVLHFPSIRPPPVPQYPGPCLWLHPPRLAGYPPRWASRVLKHEAVQFFKTKQAVLVMAAGNVTRLLIATIRQPCFLLAQTLIRPTSQRQMKVSSNSSEEHGVLWKYTLRTCFLVGGLCSRVRCPLGSERTFCAQLRGNEAYMELQAISLLAIWASSIWKGCAALLCGPSIFQP